MEAGFSQIQSHMSQEGTYNQYAIYAMADLAIAIVSMVPLEDYHFEFDKQNTNIPLVLSHHLTLATRQFHVLNSSCVSCLDVLHVALAVQWLNLAVAQSRDIPT